MDIFLARQPIFDRDLQVQAYELLYRSDQDSEKSVFQDGDRATSQVIAQSMFVTNFEKLVANKRAFIHFTDALILQEIPLLFDKGRMVIEFSALHPVGPELIDAIKHLKSLGYTIALDDAGSNGSYDNLTPYADILKVDFKQANIADRKGITNYFKGTKAKLLAKKVETREDFKEALSLGYSLFQGYFFAKPDTVKSKDIQPLSTTYLRLLKGLSQLEPSYDQLSMVVESDVAMSFKLLKLINSPAFYRRSRIQSINQALVLLGLNEFRKWVMLLMLQDVGQDKPDELLKTVLIRGRLMELIAKTYHLQAIGPECFLTGLLSLIDVMTDRDLAVVVGELSLSEKMSKALLAKEDLLGNVLGLVISYEQTDHEAMNTYCQNLKIDALELPLLYFESMEWVDMLLADDGTTH